VGHPGQGGFGGRGEGANFPALGLHSRGQMVAEAWNAFARKPPWGLSHKKWRFLKSVIGPCPPSGFLVGLCRAYVPYETSSPLPRRNGGG